MRCLVLALAVLIGGIAFPAAGDEIRVIYDQRPEADIPREARWAGTKPDPDLKRPHIQHHVRDCHGSQGLWPASERHAPGPACRDGPTLRRLLQGHPGGPEVPDLCAAIREGKHDDL